jgi:ribonuclease D
MPRPLLRRGATTLLKAVVQGSADEAPTPPRQADNKLPRAVSERYDALRAWRKAKAAELGVEPDIVVAKSTLLAVAQAAPKTLDDLRPVLDDWERDRYGAEILSSAADRRSS